MSLSSEAKKSRVREIKVSLKNNILMACYKFYEKTKQCGLTTNGISDGAGFFQPQCGLPRSGMFSRYDLVFENIIVSIMSEKCRSWVSVENTS